MEEIQLYSPSVSGFCQYENPVGFPPSCACSKIMNIGSMMTNLVSGSTSWFPSIDCAAQNTHPTILNTFCSAWTVPSKNSLIFGRDQDQQSWVAAPRSTPRTLKKYFHFLMHYFWLVWNFEGNRMKRTAFCSGKKVWPPLESSFSEYSFI